MQQKQLTPETRNAYISFLSHEIVGKSFQMKWNNLDDMTVGKFYQVVEYDEDLTNPFCVIDDTGNKKWISPISLDFEYLINAEVDSEIAKFKAYPYDLTAGNVEDEIDHAKRNIYKRGFKNGVLHVEIKNVERANNIDENKLIVFAQQYAMNNCPKNPEYWGIISDGIKKGISNLISIYNQETKSKPLTFGELKVGDKFVDFPNDGDDSGHGGYRKGFYIFEKILTKNAISQGVAKRLIDGNESNLTETMLVIKLI